MLKTSVRDLYPIRVTKIESGKVADGVREQSGARLAGENLEAKLGLSP